MTNPLLALGGTNGNVAEGRKSAEEALGNGAAWEIFKNLIAVQGGDITYVEDPDKLPTATHLEGVPSPQAGYLSQIDARVVGETSVILGAGRAKKSDAIDHGVGIEVLHKVGDYVEEGQEIFIVHANDENRLEQSKQRLLTALAWSEEPVNPLPHFYGVIGDQ